MEHKKCQLKKVLVIVAHPDDETIWMGGTLLQNKKFWNTTILSLCRKTDPDRALKFKKACRIYNAQDFMSDLEDELLSPLDLAETISRIKNLLQTKTKIFKKFDYIFTHGKNGEYGHQRHLEVNRAVIRMVAEGTLLAEKLFFFSYSKKGKICHAQKNTHKFIKLNESLWKQKKEIIRNIYGFSANSFEDLCCRNAESFDHKTS